MRDLKLNNMTWDIFVNDSGDMEFVDGVDALRQRLRIKLQHMQGEWFADTTTGMMPYTMFGVKNPDTEAISVYIKQEIESDNEVNEVTKINVSFSKSERKIYINFEAETVYGTITQNGVQ